MAIAAERMLAGVRDEMVPTAAGPVAVTVTIGGVTAPRHARSVTEVLGRAQEALDAAKRAKRRGSFLAYRPNIEREALRRDNVRATDEIVAALNERRIFARLRDRSSRRRTARPAFYECLMRIRRADGSLIAANDIMPVAERLGLVRLLDHRVLELVVDEMVAAPELRQASTCPPASTTDPDWWAGLGALLRAHPGVAERLIVEITETAAIQDIDETRGFVARVKDLGCRIAIDDFGAGYTSFRNLRKLGVDIVKIDGAFVQNIMQVGRRPRLRAHADRSCRAGSVSRPSPNGCRTKRRRRCCWTWGCDYLQGALIGLAHRAAAAVGRQSRIAPSTGVEPRQSFAAELVESLLHFVELALEIVDLAACRLPACSARRALRLASAPRKRREHGEGAARTFPCSAAPDPRARRTALPPKACAICSRNLLLLAGQRFDRYFEIARHQHLHAVAVEADQLAQEGDRQQVLPFLVLLLENDLGQHRAGDVLAGLGVIDHEILAALDHGGEIFERHIGAGAGVVEPPVGVFLDRDGSSFWSAMLHYGSPCPRPSA